MVEVWRLSLPSSKTPRGRVPIVSRRAGNITKMEFAALQTAWLN
jgi:hypothetical protein